MMSHKGFDESSLATSWSSEPFSSGLSSPLGSELGSTETEESENEDFLAELTRQMANYMLQEDDDDQASQHKAPATDSVSEPSEAKWSDCNSTSTYYCDNRFMSSSTEPTGIYYNQTFPDGKMQAIQVYELKNQPIVVKQEISSRSSYFNPGSPKQGKGKQVHHQQYIKSGKQQVRNNGLSSTNGSGMRAVFLGGSVPSTRSSTSSGTGVFLPRLVDNSNQQTQPVKRLGCSTVLIPARVLQALESHFNKNMDALSKSNGCGAYAVFTPQGGRSEQKKNSLQASNSEEMKLPEDWTY